MGILEKTQEIVDRAEGMGKRDPNSQARNDYTIISRMRQYWTDQRDMTREQEILAREVVRALRSAEKDLSSIAAAR